MKILSIILSVAILSPGYTSAIPVKNNRTGRKQPLPIYLAQKNSDQHAAKAAIKNKPKDDDCSRCLKSCGKMLKTSCTVAAAFAPAAATLALYFWFKNTEIQKG